MSSTCSYINHICNIVMYSKVEIFEKYDSSRFRRTYRFFRSISESDHLCRYTRSISISWDCPRKVKMGFEGIAAIIRPALTKTYRLKRLKLELRLRNKSFSRCFADSFRFRLSGFECNFGDGEDKRRFMMNHSDKDQSLDVIPCSTALLIELVLLMRSGANILHRSVSYPH